MIVYLNILIFLLILFFYIHIVHQYKRSEDLEIYEMDFSTNEHLQEVCEVKQPVLFDYKSVNPEFFEKLNYDSVGEPKYGNCDIKVKDIISLPNLERGLLFPGSNKYSIRGKREKL
jgi:hypothetical protein